MHETYKQKCYNEVPSYVEVSCLSLTLNIKIGSLQK